MPGTPLRERWSACGGGRLRYLHGGTGPPLVLCHGFLGSAENFETWFQEVSLRRTLLVPDLPGFGRSTPLGGAHTAEALAGAVLELVDDVGLGTFDLAGLCLGASVAQGILRLRPGRVDRLILHTPLLAPDLVRRRFQVQVMVMTAPGLFPAVGWLSRRRLVSDLYKRFMVEGAEVDPRAALANFENQCRANPRATREWLRDGLRRDDVAAIRDRRGRTLIMAAGDDRIVDVPRLRELAAGLPRVELEIIEGAGHGWTETYVRRQLEVLGRFLG